MNLEMFLTGAVIFLLGFMVGCMRRTVYNRAVEAAAKMALQSVHEFCGFMDGAACGPAEQHMIRRCMPLAKLLDYDDANEVQDGG